MIKSIYYRVSDMLMAELTVMEMVAIPWRIQLLTKTAVPNKIP